MEEVIKNKKITAKFDYYIFLAIKISLVLSVGVMAAIYWLHINLIREQPDTRLHWKY